MEEVPHIPDGPLCWKAKFLDPVQRPGPGLLSDSVLGGTLLLPSAAPDSYYHTDSHLLHQKGCGSLSILSVGDIKKQMFVNIKLGKLISVYKMAFTTLNRYTGLNSTLSFIFIIWRYNPYTDN